MVASAAMRERLARGLAELRDRVGVNDHEWRIASDHALRPAVADQQGGQPLRKLGKLDRGTRRVTGGDDIEVPHDLRVGGQRHDRRRVVKIADREAGWSGAFEPERAGAARRDDEMRTARRA